METRLEALRYDADMLAFELDSRTATDDNLSLLSEAEMEEYRVWWEALHPEAREVADGR